MLQGLTGGATDSDTGVYSTARGEPKCYTSTDQVMSPAYGQLTADRLFDAVSGHELHFDHIRQLAVVLHKLSARGDSVGFAAEAIADSREEADARLARTVAAFDQAAGRAS